jgi:phospholipase C
MADADFLAKDAFLESIHKAQFKPLPGDFTSQYSTRQEPGTRPSCALPYCMTADGRLSADRSHFEIVFSNDNRPFGDRTAGAPFNVYASNHSRAYGVKPGDSVNDGWPLAEFDGGRYHLRVYGPNGFYREFRGDAGDPAVGISFGYEPSEGALPFTGNATIRLKNNGDACTVTFVDNSYKGVYPDKQLAAGEQATVTFPAENQGWYDLSVRVKGHDDWEARYAGRIETGRDSISDPYMGNRSQA